jgi:hypothetical protein
VKKISPEFDFYCRYAFFRETAAVAPRTKVWRSRESHGKGGGGRWKRTKVFPLFRKFFSRKRVCCRRAAQLEGGSGFFTPFLAVSAIRSVRKKGRIVPQKSLKIWPNLCT